MDDGSEKKLEPTQTLTLTPTSSSKTPTSTTSSYYPNCRKDAKCHCEICLASINATRDLISPTRLSSKNKSRPFISSTPRAALPRTRSTVTPPLTPPLLQSTAKSRPSDRKNEDSPRAAFPQTRSTVTTPLTPPLLQSTVKPRPSDRKTEEKREGSRAVSYRALGFVALWLVLWVVDSGWVLKWFGPQLEMEVVGRIGEDSRGLLGDLNGRVGFVQERLGRLVRASARFYNCGARESVWELNQGGNQFFHWKCVVYKSMAEEVSIWGSPLRTSGLLSTTFSSRHLTVLSGKITEWLDGKRVPVLRAGNSSTWTSRKWSYSAVQLDPETWVLEYRRNAIFEGPRLIPTIWELMVCKISEKLRRLKRVALFGYSWDDQFVHPT